MKFPPLLNGKKEEFLVIDFFSFSSFFKLQSIFIHISRENEIFFNYYSDFIYLSEFVFCSFGAASLIYELNFMETLGHVAK